MHRLALNLQVSSRSYPPRTPSFNQTLSIAFTIELRATPIVTHSGLRIRNKTHDCTLQLGRPKPTHTHTPSHTSTLPHWYFFPSMHAQTTSQVYNLSLEISLHRRLARHLRPTPSTVQQRNVTSKQSPIPTPDQGTPVLQRPRHRRWLAVVSFQFAAAVAVAVCLGGGALSVRDTTKRPMKVEEVPPAFKLFFNYFP